MRRNNKLFAIEKVIEAQIVIEVNVAWNFSFGLEHFAVLDDLECPLLKFVY